MLFNGSNADQLSCEPSGFQITVSRHAEPEAAVWVSECPEKHMQEKHKSQKIEKNRGRTISEFYQHL